MNKKTHLIGRLSADFGIRSRNCEYIIIDDATRSLPSAFFFLFEHLNSVDGLIEGENVAESDSRVDHVKKRNFDFDRKSGRKTASDEILQLLEMTVGNGH